MAQEVAAGDGLTACPTCGGHLHLEHGESVRTEFIHPSFLVKGRSLQKVVTVGPCTFMACSDCDYCVEVKSALH